MTTDKFKGPGRPIFKFNQRAEALSALEDIDFIIENNNRNTVDNIISIKPDIYFKGPDYKTFKDDVTGNIKNLIVLKGLVENLIF